MQMKKNIMSYDPFCVVGHQGNQRPQGDQPQRAGQAQRVQPIAAPQLSIEEIRECTDNFGPKSLIGEGSYGRVYYATLQDRVAAIKKLDASAQPDQEFLSQVSLVSRLKHENVVELIGYCLDGQLRVLAYEYATMGSLHDILHGISILAHTNSLNSTRVGASLL